MSALIIGVDVATAHCEQPSVMRSFKLSGVSATTETLRPLMAKLERQNPGDRENSLYASVELSLRRLPPDLRQQVKALAVFHGGANLMILGHVIGVGADDDDAVQRLAAALIEVGLAEAMPYGHLRLDPALPNYLLVQMDAAELPSLTARWVKAMQRLAEATQLARYRRQTDHPIEE